jgi:hypothetical protein
LRLLATQPLALQVVGELVHLHQERGGGAAHRVQACAMCVVAVAQGIQDGRGGRQRARRPALQREKQRDACRER